MYHVSIKHKLNWIVKQNSLCNKTLLYKCLKFRVCKLNSAQENFIKGNKKKLFFPSFYLSFFLLFSFLAQKYNLRAQGNGMELLFLLISHLALMFNQRPIKFNNVNNIKERTSEKNDMIWITSELKMYDDLMLRSSR